MGLLEEADVIGGDALAIAVVNRLASERLLMFCGGGCSTGTELFCGIGARDSFAWDLLLMWLLTLPSVGNGDGGIRLAFASSNPRFFSNSANNFLSRALVFSPDASLLNR